MVSNIQKRAREILLNSNETIQQTIVTTSLAKNLCAIKINLKNTKPKYIKQYS